MKIYCKHKQYVIFKSSFDPAHIGLTSIIIVPYASNILFNAALFSWQGLSNNHFNTTDHNCAKLTAVWVTMFQGLQ